MTGLTPYILFAGTTREALSFYAEVFGGQTQLHTFGEFGRDDGPADAIAHGHLAGGPVSLYAADATSEASAFRAQGLMLSLLGTVDAETSRGWFTRLAEDGTLLDDLQRRPWGAYDGQLIDRFGVHWLIGFQDDASA